MYSVIIVDDDVAVLSFLSTMIPWKDLGFEVTGTYTSALDALEMSKQFIPNLVITDIGMPEMDGIEFIRTLKESSEEPRFLILSCHDDFKFAQRAVQLGVQDYILKESLDINTIKEILERIHESIKKDDHMQKKVEKLRFQAVLSQSSRKEKWLRDFLTAPLIDPKQWNKQLVEYGLNPDLDYFIPVVCNLHRFQAALSRYKNEEMLKFIIDNAMEEMMQQIPNVIYFSYTAKQFCFLFACRKDLKLDHYHTIEQVFRKLRLSLSNVLKLQFSVIIGFKDNDGSGIKHQFQELFKATDMQFYSKEPEMIRLNQIHKAGAQEELLAFYPQYIESLNRFILEGNADVEPIVNQFIEYITSRRFQPIVVKQFIFKMMLDIQMKLVFKHQYNNEKFQSLLDQMGNVSELKEWMIHFLEEAVLLMDEISKKSKKTEIIDAQKYIKLHLHQKITLEEVADRLYLNSSYFSRLFKKETGENFTEYVTRMKMEKAKELMNETNHTVDIIAEMLGYDNKGYFVKLFKNHYGVSPSRFV